LGGKEVGGLLVIILQFEQRKTERVQPALSVGEYLYYMRKIDGNRKIIMSDEVHHRIRKG
jgi:hypothetical protein